MNNTELLTDCVDEPHLYGQFASQVYLIQVNTGFRPCRRTHVSRPKMVIVGLVATSNFRLCRHCAVSLVSWCAVLVISADCWLMGNESLPEIIINNRVNLFRKTAIRILVISSHNSFRVLFDKIASVYFIWKIYFSVGNGQPSEPALCQLYRHTFVPCAVVGCGGAQLRFVNVSFLLGDRITSKTQMPTPSRPIVAFTSDALPCAAVRVLRCVAARCESGVNVSLY